MTLPAVWSGYRFCRSIICLLGRLHWFNSVVLSRVWRWSLNPPWDFFFFHASRSPTAALVENPPKRCRAYSTELLRMDLLVCSHEIPNPISIRYLHSTYSDVSKVFRSLLFKADSSTHLEATSVAVPSVVHHMLLCGITAPTDCHVDLPDSNSRWPHSRFHTHVCISRIPFFCKLLHTLKLYKRTERRRKDAQLCRQNTATAQRDASFLPDGCRNRHVEAVNPYFQQQWW